MEDLKTYAHWRYYMDDKDLLNFDYFDDIFSAFDDIFSNDNWFSRLPWNLSSECDFFGSTGIPVDIYLKNNRDYVIEAAIACYSKENISVEFDGNYLILSGKKEEKENGDKRKYLHRGIKKSSFRTKLYVPKSKYKQSETSANLEEGVLIITIPSKETDTKEEEKIKVNVS
jgi:HSP20 family protein